MFRTIPFTAMNKLVPFVWVAAVCQIISGVTLWITKPTQYLADGMFEVKVTLLIIAIVVTWYLHKTMKREVASWESKGAVSSRGLKLVSAACLLWAAVTIRRATNRISGVIIPLMVHADGGAGWRTLRAYSPGRCGGRLS